MTWGWCVFYHHWYLWYLVRHHIPGTTWSNLPSGSASLLLPHESGNPVPDFQRCWCQTFIKKWTNFSEPPVPSLVVLFHPARLAAGCGKGTTPRAPLGSVALHAHIRGLLFSTFMPVSVPRLSSDPEKERWHLTGSE